MNCLVKDFIWFHAMFTCVNFSSNMKKHVRIYNSHKKMHIALNPFSFHKWKKPITWKFSCSHVTVLLPYVHVKRKYQLVFHVIWMHIPVFFTILDLKKNWATLSSLNYMSASVTKHHCRVEHLQHAACGPNACLLGSVIQLEIRFRWEWFCPLAINRVEL